MEIIQYVLAPLGDRGALSWIWGWGGGGGSFPKHEWMEGKTEIFLIWINQFAESFFCKNGSFDQRNVLTFLFQNAVCPAKSDFVRCLFEMNASSEKNLMPFSAKIQWRWNITSCCLTVIAHSAEEVLPKLLVGAQEGRACGTTSANTNGLETLLRGPRFTARVTLGPFNWHHPRWKGRVWPYGAFKSPTHILELKKKKKASISALSFIWHLCSLTQGQLPLFWEVIKIVGMWLPCN